MKSFFIFIIVTYYVMFALDYFSVRSVWSKDTCQSYFKQAMKNKTVLVLTAGMGNACMDKHKVFPQKEYK